MPRNSGGVYTLPAGVNPVVTGTTITSNWANTTLADVQTALTDSLDRSGRGGMLAPLKLLDGTVALPGLAFTNESSTGIGRDSSGRWFLTTLATETVRLTAGVVSLPLGSAALPSLTPFGDLTTGQWSPGAGILAWSTLGVERLRVSAAGLVATTPISSSDFRAALGLLATPSYTFTGDLNTGIWSPGADLGAASAGGVEAFRWGNAFLRVSGSTYGTLGVRESGAYGGAGPNANADTLVLENNANAGISILTPDANIGYIIFGDATASTVGQIVYDHSTDQMNFVVGSTTRQSITGTLANFTVDLSSAGVIAAGGAQLDANAVLQARGNATPNAADVTGGRGTLYLSGWGSATPGNGVLGTAIAFSGVATTRRKAMIAAYQDGGTQGVTGLSFYINGSGSITNEALAEALQITSAGLLNMVTGSGALRINGLISRFESAEQACPTATTLITVAHGGTRVPDILYAVLRCKTAELGYAVGDEVMFPVQQQNTSRDWLIAANATNVYGRFDTAAVPAIRNLSTGVYTAVTTANWRVVFKAHWL